MTTLQDTWTIYKHKTTVNYYGPQSKAFNVIKEHLTTKERMLLALACNHAIDCYEGRVEFDNVCKQIEKRLNLV